MKLLVVIFAIFALWQEWQRGFFKKIPAYTSTFSIRNYFRIFAIFSVLVLLFFMFDQSLLKTIQNARNPTLSSMSQLGGYLSKNVQVWLFVLGMFFLFFILKRYDLADTFFCAFLGCAFTGAVSHMMKFIFLRARPYSYFGPYSFFHHEGFTRNAHAFQSLPSGDVALVAGAAAYLFFALKKHPLRWTVLYFPVCTALARITTDKHWPSDTLISIGIAFLIARWLWGFQQFKSKLN